MKKIYILKALLVLMSFVFIGHQSQLMAQTRSDANSLPWDDLKGAPEAVSLRDANTKHFSLPNGGTRAFVASGIIHYKRNGVWENIDNSIKINNTGRYTSYSYCNTSNTFETFFPSNPFVKPIVSEREGVVLNELVKGLDFLDLNGSVISTLPINVSNVQHTVNDNQIEYSGFYPGLKLVYTVNNSSRKFDLIIEDNSFLSVIPQSATRISINEDITSNNNTIGFNADQNGLNLSNGSEILVQYPNPVSFDENVNNEFGFETSQFKTYRISNGVTFKSLFNISWLKSSERVFPLHLDPVANFLPTYTNNWTGRQQSSTGKASGYLRITGSTTASWSKYNISSLPAGATINSAIYYGRHYTGSGNSTAKQCRLRHMTNDPVPATAATLWNESNNGTIVSPNFIWAQGSSYQWRNATLNASGVSTLQSSIAQGWYAMGTQWVSGGTGFAYHYGINGSTANVTYLRIDYTAPTCASNNVNLNITAGTYPGEVSWTLVNPSGTTVASGGAPYNQDLCLPTGCYTLNMVDSYGDGWNGANYTFTLGGTSIGTGTLSAGTSGSAQIGVGTSCAPPNPCAAAINIPSLPVNNQSVVCSSSNNLNSSNVPACGGASTLYMGGNEALYTITPSTSGPYTISYNGVTYSSIWVWANACPASGGTCVGSVSSSASAQTLNVNFTAGVTYYVMFDTWPSPVSPCPGTFSITPPLPPAYNPCSSIPNLTCGNQSGNVTASGSGAWDSYGGPYGVPGQEKLFTFTPTTTGAHQLELLGISGGWVDFSYKAASGGCNSSGWTYIDDVIGTGLVFPTVNLTAGVQYYFMWDPEGTGSYSVNFRVNCPIAGPANDLVCNAASITCGGTVSGTTVGAGNSGTGENQTCGTGQTMGGVWYVVPGNGQIMTASLCGTVWDSKISVFSGPNCSTLTCVGGNDDAGPACATSSASYSWTSVVGQNYYILVHGYSSDLAFSLALTCATPPPADPTGITSSNASICSGAGTNVTLTATGASGTVYWFTGTCAITGQIATGNSIVVSPTATTTYFARNYNGSAFSNNCASFTLTVNPLPTINAGTGGTICAGNNIQLNASSTSQTNGTLSTTFAGGNGCGAGNMFDLVAGPAPVTVNGFSLNPSVTGAQTVNVYYRAGTHVGNTTNIAAWTLLGAYTLNGTAATASYMATGNIVIPAGATYGIYVQYNANYTDGNGTNQTYSNANLTLNAGVGHCTGFDGCCAPRVFNGIVHYTVGATPTISWSPSASLSSSSILNPVATPATTTTYTVTATANGCSASSNVTVTIEAASTAPALTGTSPVCPLTSVVINAAGGTASPGSTINWYTGPNGTGSFLGTGSSYTVTPSATSTYYARREGGCNTTADGTYTITVNNPTLTTAPANGDMVWRGASNTDWATLPNWWQYNGTAYGAATAAPTAAQNVIIPANQTCVVNQPNTNANAGSAKTLRIESGANLTMGNGTLTVAENWVNNGTFTPGTGTVEFTGSGTHTVSGISGAHNFHNLTLNKDGEVQLSVPIAMSGALTLSIGRLDIGNSNLDLPTNTINGGNANSYVKTSGTGTLSRDVAGIAVNFPVGRSAYNAATLTNAGTADKYSVRVIDNVTDIGTNADAGATTTMAVVNRTWMINEQVAGGSDVTLGLNWNGAPEHIGGFQEASAFIAHYMSGAGLWDNIGGAVSTDLIVTSGITSFSPFTISSDLNFAPLPVELMSFSSVCLDNDVAIKWTTASENNSMHFVVETSTDALNWEVLSVVPAAQFSTSILNYAITHEGAARNKNYYRLKQVDLDGAVEFFNVIYANCGNVAGEPVVFPNPSYGNFTIDFGGSEMKGDVQLSIMNTEGKEISNREINLEEGVNTYQINNMELQPGIYYLKIVDTTGRSFIIKHSFI